MTTDDAGQVDVVSIALANTKRAWAVDVRDLLIVIYDLAADYKWVPAQCECAVGTIREDVYYSTEELLEITRVAQQIIEGVFVGLPSRSASDQEDAASLARLGVKALRTVAAVVIVAVDSTAVDVLSKRRDILERLERRFVDAVRVDSARYLL